MKQLAVLLTATLAFAGCTKAIRPEPPEHATRPPAPSRPERRTPPTIERPQRAIAVGRASFYGEGFDGRLTANGERFNRHAMTAAHRTFPFNTCVVVENRDNGRRVKVRVNDRGPYAAGRIIDVSEGAAKKLGMIDDGVADVRLYRCGG